MPSAVLGVVEDSFLEKFIFSGKKQDLHISRDLSWGSGKRKHHRRSWDGFPSAFASRFHLREKSHCE